MTTDGTRSAREVIAASFTLDQVAQVKALAEDAMWGFGRRLAFKWAITPEVVFGLCEDLERVLDSYEKKES